MRTMDMEKAPMSAGATIHLEKRNARNSWLIVIGLVVGIVALVLSVAAITLAVNKSDSNASSEQCDGSSLPQNVIFFISDGMGVSYTTVTRDIIERGKLASGGVQPRSMILDAIASGTMKTRSLESLVTDSAAAATALSTGMKTFNGWVSDVVGLEGKTVEDLPRNETSGKVLFEQGQVGKVRQVKTVLEGAEEKGLWTGLVSTARITHATPAAFSSHTPDRNLEDIIAQQQIDHGIEVLLGGGRSYYLPQSMSGSKRTDDIDIISQAKEKGYSYVETAAEMANIRTVPLLGLFNNSHISYAIDRLGLPGGSPGTQPTEEPTLAEMTAKAIELLSQSPKGFFLMVEAGRIDHAGHANDVATGVGEVLEYNDAMEVAVRFSERDGRTLVVGTSDHDTGGLTVGCCDVYTGYGRTMDVKGILGMRMSGEQMAIDLENGTSVMDVMDEFEVTEVMEVLQRAGVPSEKIAETDFSDAISAFQNSRILQIGQHPDTAVEQDYIRDFRVLARTISNLFVAGWTTYQHTGGDVNIYSHGVGSDMFKGVLDNSEVGQRIISLLRVNAGLNAAFL